MSSVIRQAFGQPETNNVISLRKLVLTSKTSIPAKLQIASNTVSTHQSRRLALSLSVHIHTAYQLNMWPFYLQIINVRHRRSGFAYTSKFGRLLVAPRFAALTLRSGHQSFSASPRHWCRPGYPARRVTKHFINPIIARERQGLTSRPNSSSGRIHRESVASIVLLSDYP